MRRKLNKPKEIEHSLSKVVPDTSALIAGNVTRMVQEGKLDGSEIIIPKIVMGELQAQAARGRESGFLGLEEIKKIRELSESKKINLKLIGELPSYDDIMLAKSGRIDALIQDIARKEKGVLITSDLPQALVAEAEGIPVKYFESYKKVKIRIEDFLTPDTMSLHLKEGVVPLAKRGKPGAFELKEIRKEPLTGEEMEAISKELFEAARHEDNAFIEYGEVGASVIQLGNLRVAIARPPFADGVEITVVRPIVKLKLEDYVLSEKLKKRLEEKAEGIVIAGPPGSGKSTLAAGMAEFYAAKGKIVKTMESPRDLQVPASITQYAPLEGSFAKTADILLLVRPDYTVFDEVRKTKDFEVFSDMRMAGIGMIGVVHASEAVDAVQRFLGRIELGVIPHTLDTIIFVKSGKIQKVYSLDLVVRTPTGMTEADLARPLVEIKDFETNKLEYEIYTYGDQTVVVPVQASAGKQTGAKRLAAEKIKEELRKFDRDMQVEIVSENKAIVRVRNDVVPRIIGKEGSTIKELEERLGIGIDIEPLAKSLGKSVGFEIGETGAYFVLNFGKKLHGKNANIHIDGEYLFTATVGRAGEIRVNKIADIGKALLRAVTSDRRIEAFV